MIIVMFNRKRNTLYLGLKFAVKRALKNIQMLVGKFSEIPKVYRLAQIAFTCVPI